MVTIPAMAGRPSRNTPVRLRSPSGVCGFSRNAIGGFAWSGMAASFPSRPGAPMLLVVHADHNNLVGERPGECLGPGACISHTPGHKREVNPRDAQHVHLVALAEGADLQLRRRPLDEHHTTVSDKQLVVEVPHTSHGESSTRRLKACPAAALSTQITDRFVPPLIPRSYDNK